LFLDDQLDFFPEGLYIFRAIIDHEDTAESSMRDLLSQQPVKSKCEGLYRNLVPVRNESEIDN